MNKTYVMADVHGQFDMFEEMLKQIHFTASDNLYIIGDVIDRGDKSIELIKYIMKKKNITLIKGNHESMMIESLTLREKQQKEKTDESLNEAILSYLDWLKNGKGEETLNQYRSETKLMQKKILEYLMSLEEYKIVEIKDKKFLLIHAGLYIPKPNLEAISLIGANIKAKELHLYVRDDFWNSEYHLPEIDFIVVGHTSTRYLPGIIAQMSQENKLRCENNKIYFDINKIDVDCGAHLIGGNLACLCLNDMKEFYIENKKIV